jgi:hypothetical protein
MASLALVVSLLFLLVLLIGPTVYILSLFHWMPNVLIYLLGIMCVLIGIWWVSLPLPMIRYYGLVDIIIGYKVIANRRKNATQG